MNIGYGVGIGITVVSSVVSAEKRRKIKAEDEKIRRDSRIKLVNDIVLNGSIDTTVSH